jgi:heme O synthase-like polyprenyltransferase
VLGLVFITLACRLAMQPTDKRAMGLFAYSIFYLFLLFAWMIAERVAGLWM